MVTSATEMQKLLTQVSLEELARKFPILHAVSANDPAEVKRLISEKAEINIHTAGGGKTPLHTAVEYNFEEIVGLLLEAGAQVDAKTQSQVTPLHVAAQKGYVSLITRLANAGANVNAQIEGAGCTPLHEAAAKGKKAAVIKLLEYHADPAIRENKFNLTAANLANEKGHAEIRDILIKVMSYQQQFMQNVNYILFNWIRNVLPNSLQRDFLHKLRNTILPLNDADSMFKHVSEALKSKEFEQVNESLSEVRHLLIANMKQYNADKTAANTILAGRSLKK